ncbi:MAG: ABC transporter permease [Woeseia sp.]|nr:ABC transporter permease [Woeseia sp.]NNL55659.1 ABC transporter permease [Woeseia sp.]
MLKRIFAVFYARNLEFLRDRGTLSWNLILPVVLMFGLSWIFGSGDRDQFTVGLLQKDNAIDAAQHPFLGTRYIDFVVVDSLPEAERKIARHQLDLLLQLTPTKRYWVNPESPRGYFAERVLLESDSTVFKQEIRGAPVRYVDWVLPGVLGMNMMFSCLFGVGYVVVRYRKNGFLKRLRATPLRAIEFVIAQIASRLVLIMTITVFIYAGVSYFLTIRMDGSHLALFIVAFIGAMSLISLGLMVAARVTSEELAGGLLNMVTWPMMLLSGVWFPLESAADWVRSLALVFPLTHVLNAARAVMLDGATLTELARPLTILLLMTVIFVSLAAATFRWRAE